MITSSVIGMAPFNTDERTGVICLPAFVFTLITSVTDGRRDSYCSIYCSCIQFCAVENERVVVSFSLVYLNLVDAKLRIAVACSWVGNSSI